MKIVILGLSITSSWGNGQTVTYRALTKALRRRGHEVLFLERDKEWYRAHRDQLPAQYGEIIFYDDLKTLRSTYRQRIAEADCVMIGSFVPEGVEVAGWVLEIAQGARIFYDLDTPVTIEKLDRGDFEYLAPVLVPEFDYYLSFAGGPILDKIRSKYGAREVVPFWCAVDAEEHLPDLHQPVWDLGYLGTYSADRQPSLQAFLLEPASEMPERAFAVAGPMYPSDVVWPGNVEKREHLSPAEHPRFYGRQRFTLNLTRRAMRDNGFAPSTRFFEAAACGTAILSDWWNGLDQFFVPGEEILVIENTGDVVRTLRDLPLEKCREIGRRARMRVLQEHTAERRVTQLEGLLQDLRGKRSH